MENATSAELTARLDGFFALNMDLLSISDMESRFVRVNQAWADFLGVPIEQLTGCSYLDFIHPQDISTTNQGFDQILREGELVRFVNRYRFHTGEYRSIEWNARRVGDFIHSVARDITSHLEYQADLIRRADFEAMLFSLSSLLMNATPQSLDSLLHTILKELGIHTHCDKILITCYPGDSTKMQWMYSWSRQGGADQLIQQVETPISDIPEFIERLQLDEEIFIEHIEDLPERWRTYKEFLLGQGIHALNIIPISCGGVYYGFLVLQMDGRNLSWMRKERGMLRFFARDLGQMLKRMEQDQALHIALAQQKAMYEETVRLNREIEYFMAKLSHDVRTAVHSILGFNRMLLNTDLDETQKHYASLIGNSSDFLHSLVRNVVDFSSIQAGKVEVRSIDFSLKNLVDSCIANFSLQAEEKGLSVYSELDAFIPPRVKGDPNLLSRVLMNIIGNAIGNTEEGSVSLYCRLLELSSEGLCISIEIKDTGRGIPAEELERIFEPYRQLKPVGTAAFSGSGLGLPISHCLMNAMQGTITVKSEVGVGSVFTITVPLALESNEDASLPESVCCLPPAILYEPDPAFFQQMELLLGSLGVLVFAADVPHAVTRLSCTPEVLARHRVQIFFSLDHDEDEDIFDEILHLRARSDGSSPKLIYLMASVFSPDELHRYEPLVDGFLLKPLQTRRLTDLLGAGCGCAISKPHERVPEILVQSDAKRILVLDDSQINQEIMVYLLEQMGMVVDTADNGEQALEMIFTRQYDLLLLDLNLPGLRGDEVAQLVREQESLQGKRKPIIAMTASVMQGERRRCLSIGFNDFIEKPVQSEELLKVIARWISNPA